MTHDESAAQTREGILLSNCAASAQQWRSGPYPPSMRHKPSRAPCGMGGSKGGKRQMGGGGGKMGGEEWLVGRTKAT